MKKLAFFLALKLFCFSVFAQQKSVDYEEIVTATIDGVIVPKNKAKDFHIRDPNPTKFYTPSKDEILKAESKLLAYLEEATAKKDYRQPTKPDLSKKLTNYRRQWVGIITGSKKEIWFNLFCSNFKGDWKSRPVDIDDGGGCYFRVTYDLDSGKFYALSVNGEA